MGKKKWEQNKTIVKKPMRPLRLGVHGEVMIPPLGDGGCCSTCRAAAEDALV